MEKKDTKRIADIRSRLEKTTPGKWRIEKYYHEEPYERHIKSAAVVTGNSTVTRNDWSNPVEADLEFIANSKQEISYLLEKIEELRMFESGSKQLYEEITRMVDERKIIINTLREIKEEYETDYTKEELLELEPRDNCIYSATIKALDKVDI